MVIIVSVPQPGFQFLIELYERLKKWYWMPSCLTLSIIRYESKVKLTNPRKGVVLSFTPQYNSLAIGVMVIIV